MDLGAQRGKSRSKELLDLNTVNPLPGLFRGVLEDAVFVSSGGTTGHPSLTNDKFRLYAASRLDLDLPARCVETPSGQQVCVHFARSLGASSMDPHLWRLWGPARTSCEQAPYDKVPCERAPHAEQRNSAVQSTT